MFGRGMPAMIAFCGLALVAASETGAEELEATFLGPGTYATEADCAALRKAEAGSVEGERLSPQLVTARGTTLADQSCSFARITREGVSYRVELDCRGGCERFRDTLTFTPVAGGGFNIAHPSSDKLLRLVRCDPAKADPVPIN